MWSSAPSVRQSTTRSSPSSCRWSGPSTAWTSSDSVVCTQWLYIDVPWFSLFSDCCNIFELNLIYVTLFQTWRRTLGSRVTQGQSFLFILMRTCQGRDAFTTCMFSEWGWPTLSTVCTTTSWPGYWISDSNLDVSCDYSIASCPII